MILIYLIVACVIGAWLLTGMICLLVFIMRFHRVTVLGYIKNPDFKQNNEDMK